MKALKKFLSSVSALAIILSVAVVPAGAAFNDTTGHWVGTYLEKAIDEGVIDGSKPSFRPDESITRAELVKIVMNYDNGGENPTSEDYDIPKTPTFSDVATTDWFYNHVEAAAAEGIIDASKGTFRPNAAISRAEALKILSIGLGIPSNSTKDLPYTDVAAADWFFPYVDNAYNNCMISAKSNFNPGASITRAEVVKIFVEGMTPGCEAQATTSTSPTTTTTTSPTTPTATTANNSAQVSISSKNPAGTDVPKGGSNISVFALDITAGAGEDLKLTNLTVAHTGTGNDGDISEVKLFEGLTQMGTGRGFAGDDDIAELNLTGEPVIIPAGTTKTVMVKMNVASTATSSASHGVMVRSLNDIVLVGTKTGGRAKVTGVVPAASNLFNVGGFSVGTVTFSYETVADAEVESGLTNVEIARLKATTGSEEGVYVKALSMDLKGSMNDGDLQNFKLEVDGKVISGIVPTATKDTVTFDLTKVDPLGLLIKYSSDKYISVKADLTGPIDNFGTDNLWAVMGEDYSVIGAKKGFEVGVTTPTTGEKKLSVKGGDIRFTLTAPSKDIPQDGKDVVLGTLTIENKTEAVEIQKNLQLTITSSNGGKVSDLSDIKFVNATTGSTVIGSKNGSCPAATATANNAAPCSQSAAQAAATPPTLTETFTFGDKVVVEAGKTLTLTLSADTAKTTVSGATYTMSMPMSSVSLKGLTSNQTTGFTVKPAGSLSTNTFTVKAAGVTFAGKTLAPANYVKNAKNVLVWNGVVTANNVEDIKLTRLAFVNTGTATTSDVNDYTLQYKKADGTWVNVESNIASAAPNANFTFSSLAEDDQVSGFVVKAGAEVELRLVANIGSTVTGTPTISAQLVQVSSQAQDTKGNTISFTGANISSTGVATLKQQGSLVITLDAAKAPSKAIAVEGTEKAVAVYKVRATDEDVKVQDLAFTVPANAVDTIALYYQDTGKAVMKGASPAVATVSGTTAVVRDMDLIAIDGKDMYIEARAAFKGIEANVSSKNGVAGTPVTLTLADVVGDSIFKGQASGVEFVDTDVISGSTTANLVSNVFTLMNNKVLATEVPVSGTLTVGAKELAKFKLDVVGDNEAYLSAVTPKISLSSNVKLTVDTLVLKEGSNIYYLKNDDQGVTTGVLYSNVARTAVVTPVIKTGATYTIEGSVDSGSTIVSGSSVSTDITVNTGTDGISWIDYGTDGKGGTEADVTSTWIDLGTSSVTRISGTLKS